MDKQHKKSVLGFIIAPLAGLVTIILLLISESALHIVLNIKTVNDPSLGNLIGKVVTIGIPGMYLLGFLVGFPTIYILSKLRLKKWYSYLYSSLIWGMIFCGLDIFWSRGYMTKSIVYMFFADEMICMVSFLCYWLIAVREY